MATVRANNESCWEVSEQDLGRAPFPFTFLLHYRRYLDCICPDAGPGSSVGGVTTHRYTLPLHRCWVKTMAGCPAVCPHLFTVHDSTPEQCSLCWPSQHFDYVARSSSLRSSGLTNDIIFSPPVSACLYRSPRASTRTETLHLRYTRLGLYLSDKHLPLFQHPETSRCRMSKAILLTLEPAPCRACCAMQLTTMHWHRTSFG
jgi:hypothetical protein